MSAAAFTRTPEFYTAQAELRALAIHTNSVASRYVDVGRVRLEMTVSPHGAYNLREVPRIGEGEDPFVLVDKVTREPEPDPEVEPPAPAAPSLWDRLLGR